MRIRIFKTGWRFSYKSEPKILYNSRQAKLVPEKGKILWKRRRLFVSLGRYKNPFLPNLLITPAWIQIRTRSVVSKGLDPDPDLDSAKRLDPHPDTDGLHSKNFCLLIQRPEANAYLICSPHLL
jgi:hypothetical protein